MPAAVLATLDAGPCTALNDPELIKQEAASGLMCVSGAAVSRNRDMWATRSYRNEKDLDLAIQVLE